MKLIGPFKQLLPMSGLALRGALRDTQLPVLENTGIVVADGRIMEIGDFRKLYETAKDNRTDIYLLEGNHIALPGFVDAHTHICYGGSRAADYAQRNAGKTYLQIAAAGGGIWDTVSRTRESSQKELVAGILARAGRHLSEGVTTIEVKSGYALSVEEELKMLYAIKEAAEQLAADLIPTCLAAHIVPKDFGGTATDYLRELSTGLLPKLKEEGLCRRVDAFIEKTAFSATDIAPYFKEAKRLGFDLTVHADQFTTGGSRVAIEFEALSADHLEASTRLEIEMLAESRVIATALPGASIGLGCNFTPARALLDAGAALAIASDWNPGSAPMGQLLTQAAILGAFEKLTNAEVLAGITCRAAAALNLPDRGSLEKGKLADLVVFSTDDYREVLYQQGSLRPESVWKEGCCVFTAPINLTTMH
jgi:imidazolonepropionase